MKLLEEIMPTFPRRQIACIESLNKRVIEPKILVLYPKHGHQMLGPPCEFSSVFGYLIENQYRLEQVDAQMNGSLL
jgi:hypothetical protein